MKYYFRSTDRCAICCELLLSRPFYIFSCGHMFHSDCLAEAIIPHLPGPRQKKLVELQSLVESLSRDQEKDSLSVSSNKSGSTLHRLQQAQAELDDLIAGECLFCGDIMIRNIDKPFIEDTEFNKVIAEWL